MRYVAALLVKTCGLRDYGTAQWEGGDADCDHRYTTAHQKQGATSQRQGRANVDEQRNENFRDTCRRCGATRIDSQLGLEPTPAEYVQNMVEVFREVRRVLRPAGTLWLNLGDSYASGFTGRNDTERETPGGRGGSFRGGERKALDITTGLAPKQMVGIPWRVAFALQAEGWYLRSDIIWGKPNPMPESVTDRPTKSHEYVFLLSKSPKYFFDQEAVRESFFSGPSDMRKMVEGRDRIGGKTLGADDPLYAANGMTHIGQKRGVGNVESGGRNIRTVWIIATQPYPDAHFATFPRELPERCIKAGCPEGGIVLDPFAGSGTTLAVARDLGRKSIGIELSPEYVKLIERRCAQQAFEFTS